MRLVSPGPGYDLSIIGTCLGSRGLKEPTEKFRLKLIFLETQDIIAKNTLRIFEMCQSFRLKSLRNELKAHLQKLRNFIRFTLFRQISCKISLNFYRKRNT